MKKTLITSLIAASLLVACDDKSTESTKEAATIAANKMAAPERAEQNFKALTHANKEHYHGLMTLYPLVNSIDYTVESYEKGDTSAQAKTKLTTNLATEIDGKKSYELFVSHDIKYDQAVIDSGLISSTTSKVIKPEELPEDNKLFAELEQYFRYTTDISKDEVVSQKLVVDYYAEGKKEFKGYEQLYKGQLAELSGGFGDYTFNLKGLSDGETDGFTMDAFNAKGFYKKNGDFDFATTTPFSITYPDASIFIESVTGKGNLLFDKKLNVMFSDAEYKMQNMKITAEELPTPMAIDSIILNSSTNMNDKKLISSSGKIAIKLQEGLVSSLSQRMLDSTELTVGVTFDNLPTQFMTDYQDIINAVFEHGDSETGLSTEAEEALIQKAQAMFNSAKSAGSSMKYDIAIATNEGSISSNASISFNPKSDISFDTLKEAPSSESISSLIKVNAQLKIPAVLLEKTGMQMMAGPNLKKNGEYYEAVLTNEGGSFLINDIPVPLPF